MLSFSELERGSRIVIDKEPYEIMEASHMVKGRGKSVLQTKLKNLRTGNVLSRTIRPSESFEEADISKMLIKLIYRNKGQYFFCEEKNPKNRFSFDGEKLESGVRFLKDGELAEGVLFNEEIINIIPPIKIILKVTSASPGIKGDRAQAGTKVVGLETGVELNTPLFIKEGDMVEINSETGEYVRRV